MTVINDKKTRVKQAGGAKAQPKKTAPRRHAQKIEPNPVAARANHNARRASARVAGGDAPPARKRASPKMDGYDELLAANAPKKRTAPRRTTSKMDGYDRLLAASAPKKRPAPKKRAAKVDPYDALILEAERAEAGMDEFDRYVARIEERADAGKKSRRAKKGGGSGDGGNPRSPLTWALTAMIVILVLVAGVRLIGYANFIRMRNAVTRSTYFEGTTVEGIDISNMTLADAIVHWDEGIERAYSTRTVTFDDGAQVTAAQMGYRSDAREVLEGLWRDQRAGTLRERYQNLKAQSGAARDHAITRTLYDEDILAQYAQHIASGIDAKGANAGIAGFDMQSYEFRFTEGRVGATLDQEKLISDMKAAFEAGGGAVTRAIETTQPTATIADIQGKYGLVASAITNASSSSSNRLTNIRLSAAAIHGLALEPGEEFSFNGVVGQRTAARGYQMASAYSAGEVTEEIGGGICQTSTTLFNAAVKAGLKITERHAHSMPVSYVDKGKDATVNWGSQDLKFVNTTDSTLYIAAVVTDEKRLRVGIFGEMIPDGVYITVEANVTETYNYNTNYQVNSFLAPGETNVLQPGRTGYKAVAYKMTWSRDGSLLDKELIYTSVYGKRDAIIEVPQ
ncbi:MAG: VanW family protein [Christensenellales bacterium]